MLGKEKLNKKIILSSKAAGGKDFFRTFLIGKGLKPSISQTTRDPRGNEVDGVDYHFIEEKEYLEMVACDMFHEHVIFKGNGYGTTEQSFKEDDVFIFTPGGIDQLPLKERKDFIVVYFDIPLDIRVNRMAERINAGEIQERLEKDDEAFFKFRDYDIKVKNPYFKPDSLLKAIINLSNV